MSDRCDEMRLLIQADLDGELRPAEAARVVAHLATCPECAQLQADLVRLGAQVRAAPSYPVSDAFRARIAASLAAAQPAPKARPMRLGIPFGAGFAVAAGLALVLLPMAPRPVSNELVASHIRALQPGHLMDVVSTDQHTVKPWFDGRLPFAPPVKDLAADGFPLAGGRLDYLAGQPVAALVYRRAQHIIDLYVFAGAAPPDGDHDGYNVVAWDQDGMHFRAVSDLNAAELAGFAERWKKF